jgi:hypothetical protein
MQLGIVGGEPIGAALTPQQGFSPTGAASPGGWITTPSDMFAVAAQITITSTATLDWSRAGIYQYLLTNGSGAVALTFVNAGVGQNITIVFTQASSSTATTVTYPTGSVVSGTAGATKALTNTNSAVNVHVVTCTAPGVYNVVSA